MRPTKQKRALSLLLSLAAVLSLAVLPGHASGFLDVADTEVSRAAETLSALGVVGGTGEGQFSPDGHLTRAQLCKMAVEILGMGEQAQAQAYRTIFTDMGKSHWARGYVNLAAVTQVPEESGTRLMLGLGDGTFGPDREVTYQEVVTLALRILGYSAEANRAWPHSAIETAAQLGLDRDLAVEQPSNPITRGQTALLFYHLLSTPAKGSSEPYAAKLGTLVDSAILLTGDATINGRSGWVVVARGEGTESYQAAAPVDQSLLGKRGWVLLDKEGRFVTLLPDESSCVTAPVQRRQAYYLYLNGLGRYTLSENTAVYTGSSHDANVTTYKEYMSNLRTGDMVTLYLDEQGRVVGLYRAEPSLETHVVVVGSRGLNRDSLRALTGDERKYTIRKNGVAIYASDIKQYDVVTYDPVAKVVEVCDVRLSCIYENAFPSPSSPIRVTAAGGNQFSVMADAVGDFSGRKLGEPITLLFTSNGKVAGLLPKGVSDTSSTALGVLVGNSFQLLGCDVTLKLSGRIPTDADKEDIFSAHSNQRGTLSLSKAGTSVRAQFDAAKLSLGGMRVSSSVRVYERTISGLLARSLSELPDSVTATQYHRDSSGAVDLIILEGYSGDGLNYGRIDVLVGYQIVQTSPGGTSADGSASKAKWVLQTVQQMVFTGKDGSQTYPGSGHYNGPGYGAIVEYDGTFSISYLQAVKNVSSSAFYTRDGVTYVRTNSGVYQVDEEVQCFNGAASFGAAGTPPAWVVWMMSNDGYWEGSLPAGVPEGEIWYPNDPEVAKFSSLSECRNFADTVTIYIDTTGQRVRVVEAGT